MGIIRAVNTAIERHGIESIPDQDRSATVFDFLRIAWGGGNSLPTAVLGAFPIIFGLSFWQSVAATLVGVLLGALILAPMAIFGPSMARTTQCPPALTLA